MLETRHDFDAQAGSFDRRAGLPESACQAIARVIVRVAGLAAGDLVLEIGAGTGQIGAALLQHPLRYLGFDVSIPMLQEFGQRESASARSPWLAGADANAHWPVRERSVHAIFGSRSLHLLPARHVADEACRVSAAEGAFLLIGRVQREPGSLRARLQRRMHAILAARGYAIREGRRDDDRLLAACVLRGGVSVESIDAATWQSGGSAAGVLRSWRAKERLGGVAVPPEVKKDVLDELASWAGTEFGSLDEEHASLERYVITGARLPPFST